MANGQSKSELLQRDLGRRVQIERQRLDTQRQQADISGDIKQISGNKIKAFGVETTKSELDLALSHAKKIIGGLPTAGDREAKAAFEKLSSKSQEFKREIRKGIAGRLNKSLPFEQEQVERKVAKQVKDIGGKPILRDGIVVGAEIETKQGMQSVPIENLRKGIEVPTTSKIERERQFKQEFLTGETSKQKFEKGVKEITRKDRITLPEVQPSFLFETKVTRKDLDLKDVRPEKQTISKEIKKIAETKPVQLFIGATSTVAQKVGDVPIMNILGSGDEKITVGETLEKARDLFSTGIEKGVEQVSFFGKETGKVIKGEQSILEFGGLFIPKKRPEVVLSLDEGVIRPTTVEERKPVTVFDIEKTTPTTQATSKAVEFVSYFSPAFIPLVAGDIAKSTQEIKRIEKRKDLTSEEKQELIKISKGEIGLSSAFLLGAGALKGGQIAKRGLTAEQITKVSEARVKQFRTQELTKDGKNIFSRVTQVTPEKFEKTSRLDKILGIEPEITFGKKFGTIIVETPQEVTKVGETFTLLTKKVSKATPERLSEEQIRLVLKDAKFTPTTKLTQVIPGPSKQVIKGDLVISKAPVLSFEFGKVTGRKATIDLDRLRKTTKLDELTSIVKRQRQIIPERQVFTAGTIGQEVKIMSGRKVGKPSKEKTVILEFIDPKESGVKSFEGGGKKSSQEFLQKLYEQQVQLPKSRVKKPKPTKQITETIVKDITPTVSPQISARTFPAISQEQVTVSDIGPLSMEIGMQPQLEGPRLDIISDVKLDTQQKTDIKLIQQPQLKTQARQIIDIKPDVKIDAKADTKIDTKLQIKLKTKQQIKQITDSILQPQIDRPKPRPPRDPRINKPKKPLGSMKSETVREAEKVLDIFKVFVTKKGKEVELGEFGTIEKAKKELRKELKGTLRAGGFVTEKGKKVKIDLGFGFRQSKIDPLKVVELKQRRLKKGTQETKEIQFFRKKSKKKRRIF